jgi:DNA invertase Pin-like site-specific DNA recombinase
MLNKIALYIRVSTEDQAKEGHSIDLLSQIYTREHVFSGGSEGIS